MAWQVHRVVLYRAYGGLLIASSWCGFGLGKMASAYTGLVVYSRSDYISI